jgi:hypothetical protein
MSEKLGMQGGVERRRKALKWFSAIFETLIGGI